MTDPTLFLAALRDAGYSTLVELMENGWTVEIGDGGWLVARSEDGTHGAGAPTLRDLDAVLASSIRAAGLRAYTVSEVEA